MESVQRGLGSRGYTPGPLDLDPDSGVKFEQSIKVLQKWVRERTLGAEYVEKNLAAADDFTRPFQEAMTAWGWGFGWGVPMALECFRVARGVLEEAGKL